MAETTGDKAQIDDDRPTRIDTGMPPEVQAPLAAFEGAEPPAPQWFLDAISHAPERSFVESLGSQLEVLTWGEIGKPGLLFVHGNSAHADWWSFIAPFFADDYRVAAMSLAGMGASDWREHYAISDFSKDAEAVARATGLYEGGQKPIYIGHSFGGAQVLYAATRDPEQMLGAIMIDTGFGRSKPAEPGAKRIEVRNNPTVDRPFKVYSSLTAALARFRLMPPQPVANPFIADFIARRSLRRAPRPDGSGEGWAWRFDPRMWSKLDRAGLVADPDFRPTIRVPMVHIFGALSLLVGRREPGVPSLFPRRCLEVEIPEAHHHVMIDQPLALVSAIRAVLATWR